MTPHYTKSPCIPAKPYFTKNLPETATVYDNDTITLECEVSTPAQVTWMKDTVEIPVGHEDYVVNVDGVKHTLMIPKATFDNEAIYTAKVSDKTTKCELLVDGKSA